MQNNFVWLSADYADYATQILFKLKHTIIFAHFAYSLGRPIIFSDMLLSVIQHFTNPRLYAVSRETSLQNYCRVPQLIKYTNCFRMEAAGFQNSAFQCLHCISCEIFFNYLFADCNIEVFIECHSIGASEHKQTCRSIAYNGFGSNAGAWGTRGVAVRLIYKTRDRLRGF